MQNAADSKEGIRQPSIVQGMSDRDAGIARTDLSILDVGMNGFRVTGGGIGIQGFDVKDGWGGVTR